MLSINSNDIQTSLKYLVNTGIRPFYYGYPQEGGKPLKGGTQKEKDILVRDGRLLDLKLDQHSFELVKQKTSLSTEDFYNDVGKITEVYYKEMEECIKKTTGAEHVVVFHHQIRNQDKKDGDEHNNATPVQGYADGIHTDTSEASGKFIAIYLSMNLEKKYRKGRFLYINAWRNIADAPIENDHLAILDQTSTVGPEDYIESDYHGMDPKTGYKYSIIQYGLNEKNSDQHRWHYFSKMMKDEVILFKQLDSDPKLSGRISFHTAFKDPKAAADLPCRQSIEARAMAFFPDHEPNTCPSAAWYIMMPILMNIPIITNFFKKPTTWVTIGAGALLGIAGFYFNDSLSSRLYDMYQLLKLSPIPKLNA